MLAALPLQGDIKVFLSATYAQHIKLSLHTLAYHHFKSLPAALSLYIQDRTLPHTRCLRVPRRLSVLLEHYLFNQQTPEAYFDHHLVVFSSGRNDTMYTPVVIITALLSLINSARAVKAQNPNLNAMLKMAATNYDRHTLLPKDSDWYYDFFTHPDYNHTVGAVITADAATFPAVTGMGISYALLRLGPCSMLPPHFHQRAHNAVMGITGTTTSWMINENGVRTVKVDIVPFRMTLFPQGSLHVMQNNGWSPCLGFDPQYCTNMVQAANQLFSSVH